MKNRLSDDEYCQLLACIQAIHECRCLEDFPRHVIAELRKIIECNLAGYNEVDIPRNRILVVFDPPRPDVDAARLAVFGNLMHEHPVITYFDRTGDGQALKISDFIGAREYRRRAVYRDFYRYIEAEDQMSFAVRISPGIMIGIAFNRARRSFTEKDRTRLNLVRPHIVQAYLHLAVIAGHLERQHDLHEVLPESGMGLIALNRHGGVAHSTPGAIECLARYLPVPGSGAGGLPSRLAEWLSKAEGLRLAEPLVIGQDLVRLVVRHVPGEDRELLLLSEKNSLAAMQRLDRYALTAREYEVLQWLAQGKANAEIATILGLSSGTVKLYVEHILTKLDVDNRVLAALVFHGIHL